MKKRGMRKVLFTIACVMLFAIAGGRQVFAQGENLTLQEMQRAVSVSETASGSYAWGENDTPFIARLTLRSDGQLTAKIQKTTSQNWGQLGMDFSLYDASGRCLTIYRDEVNERTTAQWKCGLLAGTYYIKEDMTLYCTGAQTSAYSFDFQAGDCFEKEYNNTKETATKIRTDKPYTGQLGDGFSNVASEQYRDMCDVYRVELKKGWTYQVNVGPLQGLAIAYLFDKDAQLGNSWKDYGTNQNVVVPYTGSYYIQIFNYSDDQYEYNLNVKTVAPVGTTLTKVKKGNKAFTATWKKQSVSGYELSYATNKKFKKAKTKKIAASKKKVTIKKLKKNRKYYVRIRTYKMINGKKYTSAWSKAKTVVVK